MAVGNLTVGGSGKTPIAIWIARYYVATVSGRGYCCEATAETRHSCTSTMFPRPWSWRTRIAPPGAAEAMAGGAEVLVLDDAYQRLDVRRDLNIAVMSAETTRAVRWPLPAGPWREGWGALEPRRCAHRDPQASDGRRGREARAPSSRRTVARPGGGRAPGASSPRRTRRRAPAARRRRWRASGWWRRRASPIPMPSWPRPKRPVRRSRWRPGRIIMTIVKRTSPGWPTRRGVPTSS